MKTSILTLAILSSAIAQPVHSEASEFSIVGQWEGSEAPNCAYRLTFKVDGEIHVESGRERLRGTYTFTRLFGPRPIGRIERIITSSNGEPDCAGQVVAYNQEPQPAFVFMTGNEEITLCRDTTGARCFARVQRK